MKWVKLFSQDELPQGARRVAKVKGHNVLLINHNGEIHAIASACPHMRLPLKGGKLTEDGAIVCPWHHSAFDLRTGQVRAWTPWPPGIGCTY